jgi:hypothetical protein
MTTTTQQAQPPQQAQSTMALTKSATKRVSVALDVVFVF